MAGDELLGREPDVARHALEIGSVLAAVAHGQCPLASPRGIRVVVGGGDRPALADRVEQRRRRRHQRVEHERQRAEGRHRLDEPVQTTGGGEPPHVPVERRDAREQRTLDRVAELDDDGGVAGGLDDGAGERVVRAVHRRAQNVIARSGALASTAPSAAK